MDYTQYISEAVVVILGFFSSIALHKAQAYLTSLSNKNQFSVIGTVTEQVVRWAEAELGGSAGRDKRDFAVKQALDILASKGIHVDEPAVIAGIEDGVTRLKEQQLNIKSIEGYFTPPTPSVDPSFFVPVSAPSMSAEITPDAVEEPNSESNPQ